MPELLDSLWGFVHGEVSLLTLEELVYGHNQALGTLFPKRTVSWLLELDYRYTNPDALRFEVGTALATVAKGCVCLRFPSSARIGSDHVFLPESASSAADFVQQHVSKRLALVGRDLGYAGRWQQTSSKVRGEETGDEAEHEFLDLLEGRFYCCRECGRSFLIVQHESRVDHLVISISVSELGESTPQLLRERFCEDFELMQVERTVPPGRIRKLE
ncbi:MAG: hypothetical protein GY811_17370 [Myxococcales bacterium]|nr:hypothetical protein [Myxococcales bacterium]